MLGTVDLLVLTNLEHLIFILKTLFTFFYKTRYLNEEVNRTEPSPSVSVLWFSDLFLSPSQSRIFILVQLNFFLIDSLVCLTPPPPDISRIKLVSIEFFNYDCVGSTPKEELKVLLNFVAPEGVSFWGPKSIKIIFLSMHPQHLTASANPEFCSGGRSYKASSSLLILCLNKLSCFSPTRLFFLFWYLLQPSQVECFTVLVDFWPSPQILKDYKKKFSRWGNALAYFGEHRRRRKKVL
jgi:hypothetical protein